MRNFVMIKKHGNDGMKSDIPRHYSYEAVYGLMLNNEDATTYKNRSIKLTEESIRDILYNLPEEFENSIRIIKDKKDALPHDFIEIKEPLIQKKEEVDHLESVDTKVIDVEDPVEPNDEGLGGILKPVALLDIDYKNFSKEELAEHVSLLKTHAKDNGITIHPATKNIEKILETIRNA